MNGNKEKLVEMLLEDWDSVDRTWLQTPGEYALRAIDVAFKDVVAKDSKESKPVAEVLFENEGGACVKGVFYLTEKALVWLRRFCKAVGVSQNDVKAMKSLKDVVRLAVTQNCQVRAMVERRDGGYCSVDVTSIAALKF